MAGPIPNAKRGSSKAAGVSRPTMTAEHREAIRRYEDSGIGPKQHLRNAVAYTRRARAEHADAMAIRESTAHVETTLRSRETDKLFTARYNRLGNQKANAIRGLAREHSAEISATRARNNVKIAEKMATARRYRTLAADEARKARIAREAFAMSDG